MTKTNPKIKKKTIVGYIGTSVGANNLFKFEIAKKGEYFEGKILKRNYSISKEKTVKGWRTVKLTIEISG